MRLLLRLADAAGTIEDLRVELAADVRVGELADAIASHGGVAPGSTVAVRWPASAATGPLPRDGLVAALGPRSGSTVELVPEVGGGEDPPTPSPVVLVTGTDAQRLDYGPNRMGPLVIEIGDAIEGHVVDATPATVNGERLLGRRRLAQGDLLGLGAQLWRIEIGGVPDPPPGRGPWLEHRRTPRRDEATHSETVELPSPPSRTRVPGFPVLSAMVPLLMGAGLWALTRSLVAAAFVLFSFVFIVASGIEARREARAEHRFRIAEFRAELEHCNERIAALHRAQRTRLDEEVPSGADVLARAHRHRTRLWDRSPPRWCVRVGEGPIASTDRVLRSAGGDRTLRSEADRVAHDGAALGGPVVLDLLATGGVAVVGDDERAPGVARSVVAQLVTQLGPDVLALRTAAGPGRAAIWRWCHWLPHSQSEVGGHRVVVRVVDGSPGAASCTTDGLTIWLSTSRAGLPDHLGAVLELAGATASLLVRGDGGWERTDELRPDLLHLDEVEPLARTLAGLRPELDHEDASLAEPGPVTLGDVLDDAALLRDPSTVERRWAAQRTGGAGLGAPVGRAQGATAHLDLRLDGPHALVAGTTGSGKSELLRTVLVSLALHHPPDRVNLLLVDYKGGAAFRQLAALPHAVGLITDLTDELARRALRSLRAEVRRREHLLAHHGVGDLDGLRALTADSTHADSLPALVVVVDEFATLLRELPEFVDGLVDVAQRGRSLGIHLVLATQRPAGVITDAIRANTALRIALRVTDVDDSRDVVDVADAATLPRDRPGLAVVRVGPSSTTTVQTAYSGAPATERARVTLAPLDAPQVHGRATVHDGPEDSELDLAVRTITAAFAHSGAPMPRRPWVEPLPDEVALDDLHPEHTDLPNTRSHSADSHRGHADALAAPGRLTLGLVDLPDEQCRSPLVMDLTRVGGILICGASGSGRSAALRAIAVAGALHRGESIHVHAIDAGGSLAGMAGVGDVVDAADAERVLRLLRDLVRTVRSHAEHSGPRRVLLVDGYAALAELHERIGRGEALDLLAAIAREGRARRVHLAVTAQRRSELPQPVAGALGAHLHLRAATEDDAALAGLPPWAADIDRPPGRALFDGREVQLARPGELHHPVAPPVGRLPRTISLDRVELAAVTPDGAGSRAASPWHQPLGLSADELTPVALELTHHHAIVAGPPRCGRSSALATLTRCVDAVLVAPRHGPADDADWSERAVGDELTPTSIERLVDRAVSLAASGTPTVVAIDDLPELLDSHLAAACAAALERLLDAGRSTPVRLIVAGEVDALLRCYDDGLTRLRSGRTGVLLGCDPDLHATLLHAQPPRLDELEPAPGRGWLVTPGGARAVQVALPGPLAQGA